MTKPLPAQDYLASIFRYDPETGKLFWRERSDMRPQWNAHYAGKEAGSHTNPRKVQIVLNNAHWAAHRIIWKMVYGTDPSDELDHADCNPHNNKLDNLRRCSRSQNLGNTRSRNKTGFKGVTLHRSTGLWNARIASKSLGYFKTARLAHAAYVAAAELHFGQFARAA